MSGKGWVDRVPDNWNLVRFSKAYRFSRGLDIKKQDLSDHGLPVISYGQIHAKDNPGVRISDQHIRYIPKELVKEAQLGRALLEEGDIVFADTSEDIEGAGNMVRAAGGSTLYAGYHALIARPSSGFRHKYMAYQMISPSWRQQIQRSVQGVKVYSITQRIFNEVTILQPPRDEQRIIARFLDLKTAEIDALIEKLSLQVELLERYRRELIARTVTRGLNPDVPLRDSGIEWIGKIPEHWTVERMQWRVDQVNVDNDPFVTDQILSLVKDVGVVPFEKRGLKGNKAKTDLSAYKVAFPGTIVMNSMNVIIGSVGISNHLGLVSPVYYVFKNKMNTSLRFLNYVFQTRGFQKELRKYANGILEIRLRISANAVLKRMLAFPPLEEQRAIADYLDDKMAEIDSVVAGINKQIDLLGKYRKQVINDLVTGKVGVGEVA